MSQDTPRTSPIEALLTQLVERDEARSEAIDGLRGEVEKFMGEIREAREEIRDAMAELRSIQRDMKSSLLRQEATAREIRNELLRQDQQIQGFDRRISGNYMGVSAQLDVISEEMRETRALLGNMERAVVESSKDMRVLHGRFIELSGGTRERLGVLELAVTELAARIEKFEGTRVSSEEIIGVGQTTGGVLEAAGGGGG